MHAAEHWSPIGHLSIPTGADAELAQCLVEAQLPVGGVAPPADDERARDLVDARWEILRPRPRHDDRPWRNAAAVLDRLRARDVDDRNGGREGYVRRDHRTLADHDALDDDRPG